MSLWRYRSIGYLTATIVVVGLSFACWWRYSGSDSRLFELGKKKLEQREISAAIDAARELQSDPKSMDQGRLLEAMVALALDRPMSALDVLKAADQTGPLRRDILLHAAIALYRLNEFGQCVSALEQLAAEGLADVEVWRLLSAAYFDLGALDAVVRCSQEVIRLDPSDFHPHYLLGIMYFDFELYAEAIASLTTALRLQPDAAQSAEMRLTLIRALTASRAYAEALDVARAAENSAGLLSQAAVCHWNLGQIDECRRKLELAEAFPELPVEYYLTKADLLSSDGHSRDALEVLKTGVARFPSEADLYYRLALESRAVGETANSEQYLSRWEELKTLATELTQLSLKANQDAGDRAVRERLAEVCHLLGREQLAEMWRKAANACKPNQEPAAAAPESPGK